MVSKRAREQSNSQPALPELPAELWDNITSRLTANVAGCACVRLLNKHNASEYEFELLGAAVKAEFAKRRRGFEQKRERADARVEPESVMTLGNLGKLHGELTGEARMQSFLFGMVKRILQLTTPKAKLVGSSHPMRMALAVLRDTPAS